MVVPATARPKDRWFLEGIHMTGQFFVEKMSKPALFECLQREDPLNFYLFLLRHSTAEFPMLLPKGNIHSNPERTSATGRWLLFKCLIHSQWYWLMHEPNICATLSWLLMCPDQSWEFDATPAFAKPAFWTPKTINVCRWLSGPLHVFKHIIIYPMSWWLKQLGGF